MRYILAAALLLASLDCLAATAHWTGQRRMVQTVTYQIAWECEYYYNGRYFTEIFQNSCPSSIEVR